MTSSKNMSAIAARRERRRRLARVDRHRIALPARVGERELQPAVGRRRQLRGDVRRDEREPFRQQHAEPVAAQAAHPDDVLAVHHVGARILVGLVDQHAADAALRHRDRQRRVDRVVVRIAAFLLVGELQRLAGARIVDLDAGALAAAARRVDELGRADARFLRQEADAELLAARLEQRVLGVGVLREQARRPAASAAASRRGWCRRETGCRRRRAAARR